MKKVLSVLLVAALVLSVGAVSAFAAVRQRPQCPNFVDADGDGICDNCDSTCPQNGGSRMGGRRGNCGGLFVDADGDGICDNRQDNGTRPQDGTGARRGRRGGRNR